MLAYAIATTIVPTSPLMPTLGPDPSWRLAINRATSDGLQFGRDIVFTYGPYGSVLTRVYEPGIHALMFGTAVLLAAGCLSAALLALRRSGLAVHLGGALAVVLLSAYNLDSVMLVYPLVAAFAVTELPRRRPTRLMVLIIVFTPLGALPITKLSLVPGVAVGVLAAFILLLNRRDWAAAATCVLAPVTSLLFWWNAAGQSPSGLLTYARATWPIVAGYSEAMSLHDTSRLAPGAVTAMYIAIAAVLAGVSLWTAGHQFERLVLGAALALTLLFVFKAGYVRADEHMEVGALALLTLGVLVLGGGRTPRLVSRGVGSAVIAVAALIYLATTLLSPVYDLRMYTVRPIADLIRGDVTPRALHKRYDDALADIRAKSPLPRTVGSSDLYPSGLAAEIAGSSTWKPRPVIQSYSTYTAGLAELNARHLESSEAPRTVFFGIHPIDGRLAALEDGASWIPLVQYYDISGWSAGHLVLEHRRTPRRVTMGAESQTLNLRLGQTVAVPDSTSAWLASFDVRPTLLGRVRRILWKPPQLRVELRTASGEVYERRFVPAMARAEFLLSPYVATTKDFAGWFRGNSQVGTNRRVTSLRLDLEDPHWPAASQAWESRYTLRIRSLVAGP